MSSSPREKLKALVILGKSQGYLTWADLKSHLPEGMLDPEQIENIASMLKDMGIDVYDDDAPDPDR
jgi:RNA polymerase primary sigma factor